MSLSVDALLSIFNSRGQPVYTWRLKKRKSTVIWSGNNQNGERVLAGLYFFEISNGNQKAIGKIQFLP